jgi:long-chain acyl-CoA synthetase
MAAAVFPGAAHCTSVLAARLRRREYNHEPCCRETTLSPPPTPESVGSLLSAAVERWGPAIALRRRREPLNWSVSTWTELGDQVRAVAGGLLSLGIKPGDRIGLLSNTRVEWTVLDYGALSIGAVVVPIYHSGTPQQIAFALADSGSRMLVLESRAQLEVLGPYLSALEQLERKIVFEVMDLREHDDALLFDELIREGRRYMRDHGEEFAKMLAGVGRDDLATIVYTSGTTGAQKGVRITHGNILAAVESIREVLPVGPDDTTLLCLPLSHIFPRLAQFAALSYGFCIAYARRVDLLSEVLREVRPTFFFAVPRIYERLYHRVVSGYRELPPLVRTLVRRGVVAARESGGAVPGPGDSGDPAVGTDLVALPPAGGKAGRFKIGRRIANRLHGEVAERTLFEGLRAGLGGRIRFCVSGGAPLSSEVAEFFRLASVEVLEGYGLTECMGTATLNRFGDNRIGTVGRPLPGVRVRIAPDGEVLLRGDMVFDGYHNQPEETAIALSEAGWLHTGDVGSLDDAGFLLLTDRKKDIIVTSGGKHIAPQRVEAALRMSPYFLDAMVFGDRRPFLVALLTLSEEEIRGFAESLDLPVDDWGGLQRDARVRALLDAEMERCNSRLAHSERVRSYRILRRALTVEGGELTPTMKVRRRIVWERNRPLIEGMYAQSPPA